jgi:hypothetical protein
LSCSKFCKGEGNSFEGLPGFIASGWAQKSQKTQKEFLAEHDELLKFQEFYETRGTFHFVRFLKFEM